jgi:hypothetical protein
MKKGFLNSILRSPQTVFSFNDLMLAWDGIKAPTARARVNYYVKTGELIALRRGLYAKDENFNRLEMATKIFSPAYISFETVLAEAGIIFQLYHQVFVASYQTREIAVSGQSITFRTISPRILLNPAGIRNRNTYMVASPERAFLDTVYLFVEYHFDYLAPLDWKKIDSLLTVYGINKAMIKRVSLYRKTSEGEHNNA